jgi:hypothetical protein
VSGLISVRILFIEESSGENLNTSASEVSQRKKDGLYALQALVQPIAARFKYHFEGNKETNRIDKVFVLCFRWYQTDLPLAGVVLYTRSQHDTPKPSIHGHDGSNPPERYAI